MSLSPGARFDRLVAIMHLLRGPDGCPWDREQTLQSLRPFVIEETSELLDALDAGDMTAFKDELGDFLFEAVFLAELCAEAGHFTIADSVQSVIDKLIRRHPHVFTPEGDPLPKNTTITASGVKAQWDDIKQEERAAAGQPEKTTLSGIPRALPALLRADQLSRKAASVGFDWQRAADVLDKLDEEVRELREANDKFQDRFEHMERAAHADGQTLGQLSPADLDARWNAAKRVTGNTKSTKHTKDTE
jgi:MazG family protein